MARALEDTFSLHMGPAHQADEADVLLITDGEVWDAERIVDDARRSGHRVYALGVGSAPAESLLREMAEATGGACEFATPRESMAVAIQRLLARIRLALPVQARLESSQKALWCSPMPRRLAAVETVHLFMRLPAIPQTAPLLDIAGLESIPAELSVRDDDLIARLVAAREIGHTADRCVAARMAERYQLVTDETNLLLVIDRAEADKTNGMPTLHQVRPMLAAGWGGSSTVVLEASQIRYSRRQNTAPAVFRMASQSVAFDAGDLAMPSVWRSSRASAAAKVDALVSGGMDDFEIPAFLRKNVDATPAEIIAAFNQAATKGQGFRQTLRAVTDLSLDPSLCKLIVEVARHAGGPMKAWACYLLWLHESTDPALTLTAAALAVVDGQVKAIDAKTRAAIDKAFSERAAA